MSKLYTNILLLKNVLTTIIIVLTTCNIVDAQYTPNPKIKVNYYLDSGMMRAFVSPNITDVGGACAESGGIEARVHLQFKSSTGPTSLPCCKFDNTGCYSPGLWSCDNRAEKESTTCGTWFPNAAATASYPSDAKYTDTSAYPCYDSVSIQMKGFETDQFLTFCVGTICNTNKLDYNYNDGACQSTCTNGNCYGNYLLPTSGYKGLRLNIGTASNTLGPYCGSTWSPNYQSNLESAACSLDGYTNYYYAKWKYRWCWDSSTLFDRHAGGVKVPTVLEYCSGANINVSDSIEGFEVTKGYTSYQWEKNSGSGWSDIVGATSKDLSTNTLTNTTVNSITYQIRRATLFCTDFLATPTKTRVYSNIISVNVYPQPIAPTLYTPGTSPANGTTICKGLFVYAQFNHGTGGYADAIDSLQFSIDNGLTWNNYTAGNSINTASANTAVLIRGLRTAGSLSSCNATSWTTLVNWPISATATPPSLLTSNPANNTPICLSGTSQITGTITQGSGGTGYEYGYSITNASTPSTIITGTPPSSNFTINTSGATTKINLFGRRTGVGAGACSPTPWALIGEWPIINQPNSPTLSTQTPSTTTVDEGNIVSITTNNGNGGATDAFDEYRISSDNGNTWITYVVASNYTVPIGASVVIIQGRRNAGISYGCINSTWSNLASWSVNTILPVELISFTGHKNDDVNYLNWITASEVNSKEFIIQKSTTFNNWLEIGKISAHGNSSQNQYYNFIDSNSYENIISYYRLKLVDFDNSYKYSDIISVDNRYSIANNIILYPNPTNSSIKLISSHEFSDFSYIRIEDILGKIIKEIKLNKDNNIKQIEIDCSEIQKGNYFVCIYDKFSKLCNTFKLIKY